MKYYQIVFSPTDLLRLGGITFLFVLLLLQCELPIV